MNKKIIIPIIIVVGIFLVLSLMEPPDKKDNIVFHVTLADPKLYKDGVYSDSFVIEEGGHHFRFVPNGSSPQTLSISISENVNFNEEFELKGTLHQPGLAEYYTWEYVGVDSFFVSNPGTVDITIDPNGNVMGSVSVDILKDQD